MAFEDIKPYPAALQKLNTTEGFIEEYHKLLPHCKTHNEAYESVEALHEKYFFKRKYNDLDSFKKIRKRFLAKNSGM